MSGYGPWLPVDGPVPQPPRYGLLAAATIITSEDEFWANGVEVWPYPADLAQGQDPCGAGGSSLTKAVGGVGSKPQFAAFTAYLPGTCNARGIATNDDFRARVVAAFAAQEGAIVEKQFAAGAVIPTNPNLGDANLALPLGTTSTSPTNALAVLENQIGETGQTGVLHVDPATFTAWAAEHLLAPAAGAVRYTERGTAVAVGNGYIGARPHIHSAPSACEGWAFATGPVAIRRSPEVTVFGGIAENLDRATNTLTFRAERNYVVYWDGTLQVGVLIDRNKTGC